MSDENDKLKEVHWYAQCVSAWFKTKLERDKGLLTLSTAGIGLLVTLVATVGVKSVESFILYILALISFIICMITVLFIFSKNATYLEKIKNNEKPSSTLGVLDKIAITSFIFALIMASIFGVSVAYKKILMEEIKMTKTQDSFDKASAMEPKASAMEPKAYERATESFDNAQSMGPTMLSQGTQELIRSFNGAQNMGPSTPQGGAQQTGTGNQQATSSQSGSSTPQNTGSGATK